MDCIWKLSLGVVIFGGCVLMAPNLVQAVKQNAAGDPGAHASTSRSITQKASPKRNLGELGKFPREILIQILNIIRQSGEPQNIRNVAGVCKKLNETVLNTMKSMAFKAMPPGLDIEAYKTKFSKLEAACLSEKGDVQGYKTLFDFLPGLTALKKLDLHGLNLTASEFKALLSRLPQSLEVLNVADNRFEQEGAKALAETLANGRLPNLQALDISDNTLGDEGMATLAPHFSKLVSLNVGRNGVQEANPFIDTFNKGPAKLKELMFAHNGMIDAEQGRLIAALPQTLEKIDLLSFSGPQGNSSQASVTALNSRRFPELRELDFSGQIVTPEDVAVLIPALAQNAPKLQVLKLISDIRNPAIGKAKVKHLVEAFQQGQFSNLKLLNLSGNLIKDVGFVSFMGNLPQTLEALILNRNGIKGDFRIGSFMLQRLKQLSLENNPLSQEAKQALTDAERDHPQLKISF